MNSVTFSGRVGQDPASDTVDDQPVAYLTVYENRRTRRDTEWVNDLPNVWRVEAHGQLAELAIANITKGSRGLTLDLGHVESSRCWRKRDDQDHGQEELLR